jgi:tRNA pseudouridine38-40 synthase
VVLRDEDDGGVGHPEYATRVRLRLDVAYDGGDFKGWAAQPGLRTVEGDLSAALATVLRLPSVGLTCAGRTDSGVHARGQVVHVDLASLPEGPDRLVRRLNGVLAGDVRVLRAVEAPPGFDARFSAVWRRYAYRVVDHPAAADPLARGHVLLWPRPLDVAAMGEASAALRGLHDFAAFCKQREGATTIRTLLDLDWARGTDGVVVAGVRADAFCHSMVRSLVGCLLAVGEGRKPVSWPAETLATGSRDAAVAVAPAHGLTLEEVGYPPDEELAARSEVTRARRA